MLTIQIILLILNLRYESNHQPKVSLKYIFLFQVEFRTMTVFVSMSPQTIYMSGLDPHGENMDIPVRVLDCDTITQVDYIIDS